MKKFFSFFFFFAFQSSKLDEPKDEWVTKVEGEYMPYYVVLELYFDIYRKFILKQIHLF